MPRARAGDRARLRRRRPASRTTRRSIRAAWSRRSCAAVGGALRVECRRRRDRRRTASSSPTGRASRPTASCSPPAPGRRGGSRSGCRPSGERTDAPPAGTAAGDEDHPSEHVYVVPRASGETVIGATVEDAGYDESRPTRRRELLLRQAIRAVPAVAELELVEAVASLRPGTPDDGPLIGEWEGLLVAVRPLPERDPARPDHRGRRRRAPRRRGAAGRGRAVLAAALRLAARRVFRSNSHGRLPAGRARAPSGVIAAAWASSTPLPFASLVRGVAVHDRGTASWTPTRWARCQKSDGSRSHDAASPPKTTTRSSISWLQCISTGSSRRPFPVSPEDSSSSTPAWKTGSWPRASIAGRGAADEITDLCDGLALSCSFEQEASGSVGSLAFRFRARERDARAVAARVPELRETVVGFEAAATRTGSSPSSALCSCRSGVQTRVRRVDVQHPEVAGTGFRKPWTRRPAPRRRYPGRRGRPRRRR